MRGTKIGRKMWFAVIPIRRARAHYIRVVLGCTTFEDRTPSLHICSVHKVGMN
jgi:hypothetical protein